MNKTELISAAAERSGVTKKDTEKALNAALELIVAHLSRGEKIQLSGFGNFEVRQREARVGRNPHTGESVSIPAAKVPVFKPSKLLKDSVEK